MAENNKGEVAPGLTEGQVQGPAATDCAAVMVYATFPSPEQALETGRKLVEAGLAACINILPAMTSIYRWQCTIETAHEAVLLAKTVPSRAEAVTAFIVANHPYEIPAVVVIPIVAGSSSYLRWITDETAPATRGAT